MFRIKKRNMDALVAAEERAFEARVVQRLRDSFDHLRGASDDDLQAFVRLGRERALTHDIRSFHGVSLYVGLMAELGADFDTSAAHAWVREWLHNPHLTGNARIECVCNLALEKKARPAAGGDAR